LELVRWPLLQRQHVIVIVAGQVITGRERLVRQAGFIANAAIFGGC
jgi:hypothetical protein